MNIYILQLIKIKEKNKIKIFTPFSFVQSLNKDKKDLKISSHHKLFPKCVIIKNRILDQPNIIKIEDINPNVKNLANIMLC